MQKEITGIDIRQAAEALKEDIKILLDKFYEQTEIRADVTTTTTTTTRGTQCGLYTSTQIDVLLQKI